MSVVYPSNLDFSTLFVELLKIQEYLKTNNIEVNTTWAHNHNNDLMVICCRVNFRILQLHIVRSSWDAWREFSLIDNYGTHCFRIDPTTGDPVRIDKTNLIHNIWVIGALCHETRESARELFQIISELEKKLLKQNNEFWHEQAKKSTPKL